jgi:sporulation-control protein spo0M
MALTTIWECVKIWLRAGWYVRILLDAEDRDSLVSNTHTILKRIIRFLAQGLGRGLNNSVFQYGKGVINHYYNRTS